MRRIVTGRTGGDDMAPYSIYDYKAITVSDFVTEVLAEEPNEWGRIEVDGFGSIKYRDGKLLSEIPESWKHLTVVKLTGYGGWSCMDYRIKVNPKVDYYRLYQK